MMAMPTMTTKFGENVAKMKVRTEGREDINLCMWY